MVLKQYGLPPLIQSDALLVILGSFPGVASLKAQQYYGYPHNQFWPIVGTLLGQPQLIEFEYEAKKQFLMAHKIALWDVYKACERQGSLDSNIKKGEANDLSLLLNIAPSIKVIAHNGKASANFMKETQALGFEISVFSLPSSSPAYASMRFAEKLKLWEEAFTQAGLR